MSFPFFAYAIARRAWPNKAASSLLACALALHSADVFSNDAPLTLTLTLSQAQQLAVAHSRQLSAQDSAIFASQEMAVGARQLPDPILKLGVDNLPVDGRDRFNLTRDFMTMRRIGLMQEIPRGDKLKLRTDRFERMAEKSVAEKSALLATIERDTAIAWLDRYYAEKMAAIIAEQSEQAHLEIQAAEGAYRAGRDSLADVMSARSALGVVEDRSIEITQRVTSAKTMLARWTGSNADIALAGTPATESIRLNPESLDTQLGHHPEIAVLSKVAAVAEADAKLAQADKKADWSVEAAFQQRGPAYANMISLGVSIPLQWNQKNLQNRALSSKLALLEQAKSERDEMLRQHVAETRIMMTEWENLRQRSQRYTNEWIPLAIERTTATLAAYRGGKVRLSDVLASRRNEIDVRLQTLQLQADAARLWAQLNFLSPGDASRPDAMPAMNKDSQ